MAQADWTATEELLSETNSRGGINIRLLLVVIVLLGAVGFLATRALQTEGQFFITLEEYYAQPSRYTGRDLRVSAFVVGDSIQFTQIDAENSLLEFDIVDDINNPAYTMHIVAHNEPLPDLLEHEATAIVEGSMGTNGSLTANPNGLLLKCPTRYESADQAAVVIDH